MVQGAHGEIGMRRPRIIFVNRVLGIFRGGGETADLNFAAQLRRLGCDVEFITGSRRFGTPRQIPFPTTYIRTPYLRPLAYLPFRYSYKFGQLDLWLFGNRVIELLKRKRADIVQVCGAPELALRIHALGFRTVVRFPGPPPVSIKGIVQRCDAVFANGDAYAQLKQMREDARNIPIGIDARIFRHRETDVRERYGIGGAPLLLYVGRFAPLKNLPLLIDAFAAVVTERPEARLMMAGTGDLMKSIKRRAEVRGVAEKIIFTGEVPYEALPRYYSAADIFVLSSHYDNFPNAVLEAMSCGLPIVATRVGGVPLLVEDGENGRLTPPGDADALKDAVLRLLADDRLRRVMGCRNREKARSLYSWDASARKLLAFYRELLRTPRRSVR
jgi:glycosyltransferase involved in cell wall biosynthesis